MMTYILIFAAGALVKTLLPFPAFDDRVRAAWSWTYDKVVAWLR